VAKKALGRGLEALIPQSVIASINTETVMDIPLDTIKANPHQPRKKFDSDKIKVLAESIRKDGILQPVVVRKRGESYELIMGERRLQAARLAGVPSVPAILKEVEDVDALRLALSENLHRENLNPIEEADAFRELTDTFGLSQAELAEFIGRDRSSVANTMRLLKLPDAIKLMLTEQALTEGHARALLAVDTQTRQLALANEIVTKGLSVREAELEAGLGKRAARKKRQVKEKPTHIQYLEKSISKFLGTRVNIVEKRGGKGKLVIEFYSHEDFERISELMQIPLPR